MVAMQGLALRIGLVFGVVCTVCFHYCSTGKEISLRLDYKGCAGRLLLCGNRSRGKQRKGCND